jgi:hypothetical protein
MEALIEEIVRKLHHLPEVKILEVLDFVEFLTWNKERSISQQVETKRSKSSRRSQIGWLTSLRLLSGQAYQCYQTMLSVVLESTRSISSCEPLTSIFKEDVVGMLLVRLTQGILNQFFSKIC